MGVAVLDPGRRHMSALLDLDARLFVLLNQRWTHPVLDVVMPFVTDFDHWRIPVIGVLLVLLARGGPELRLGILFAVLAVVVADQISSSGIKAIVERARPFDVIEGTRRLSDAYGFAFPSSHAANTFAAGTFLATRFRRSWPLLALPALVGYSRVYVGVHWPLDVAAGAAVGAAVGLAAAGVERVSRLRLQGWFASRKDRKGKGRWATKDR
ncbi:MAG: phosphatase PAP2 family protein [Candidatus Eiseniibacteriota bacterium]